MNQQQLQVLKKKQKRTFKPLLKEQLNKNRAQSLNKKVETIAIKPSKNTSRHKNVEEIYVKPKSKKSKRCKSRSPKAGKSTDRNLDSSKASKRSPHKSSKKIKRNEDQSKQSKKLDEYMKVKLKMDGKSTDSYFQSTHSFYPLSQDKDENINNTCIASRSQMPQVSLLKSKFQEPEYSANIIYQIPEKYQNFYQQSRRSSPMPQSKHFSKEEWEAYQGLKMKNQELNNYIQQLQKIEQKMALQSREREETFRKQHVLQKNHLLKQITGLKQEQKKIVELNASLQQMFNQGKQNIDFLNNRCNEIMDATLKKQQQLIIQKQKAISHAKALEVELSKYHQNLHKLQTQRNIWVQKIDICNRQKEQVKLSAQQLLQMVQLLQKNDQM